MRHILSKSPLRDLERSTVKFIRVARAFALYGKVLFCTYSTQNDFPIARKFLNICVCFVNLILCLLC